MGNYCMLLLLLLMLACSAVGRRTDKCNKGFGHCGENKCCCKDVTANCKQWGKKLHYIPPLPRNITTLYFLSNSLPVVTRDTFKNITQDNIEFLSLAYNNITNISEDAFTGFSSIKTLTLNGNMNISKRALSRSFQSIPKTYLQSVFLEKVGIDKLSGDFFETLSESNVTNIHLNKNLLKTLNMKVFKPLTRLESLSVRENHITEIAPGVGHESLEDLDLSNNEIAVQPRVFCGQNKSQHPFPNLRHVDLRTNFISEFLGKPWQCLYRLEFLGLSENSIRRIKKNTFGYLSNLHELQMSNMHGSIQYIGKYAFNNSRLQTLNLEKNSIVFKRTPNVYDLFQGAIGVRKLVLSNNNFRRLGDQDIMKMLSPLQSLQKLTLEHGNIHRLPTDFVHSFPNLTTINLGNNNIDTLKNVFTHSNKVTKLSLQSNNIRVVDQESLSDSLIKSIKKLDLAFNPLECTCEMLWFRDAIGDGGTIGNLTLENWPQKYSCASPTKRKGMLFRDYRPTSAGCRNVLLISIISLVSVLLLGLVTSIVSYRYRWYIAYWCYKLKTKRKHKLNELQPLLAPAERHFHGYVIYHTDDRNFIRTNLLQLMEVQNDFKLHVWDRDSIPGSTRHEEVADSIYVSDSVIAVVSRAAVRDSWFRFQLDVALDRQIDLKRDFVVLVLLDNIEFKLLSKYWCVMFARLLCVRWCEAEEDIRRRVFEQQLVEHCAVARQHDNAELNVNNHGIDVARQHDNAELNVNLHGIDITRQHDNAELNMNRPDIDVARQHDNAELNVNNHDIDVARQHDNAELDVNNLDIDVSRQHDNTELNVNNHDIGVARQHPDADDAGQQDNVP